MKKMFLCLCGLLWISAQGQIKKMEPPMWWSGMNWDQVEVLFYGPDISSYEVTSELDITEVRRTGNPDYLFVTVDTQGKPPGTYDFSFRNPQSTMQKEFILQQRKPGAGARNGFDSEDVIYLLMPDRFANGKPQNDSHPELQEKADRSMQGGRHGGDIEGIIAHLDYLQDLGVTAIWSTPLLEDDDPQYSYHTYAQSDVYRIDPRYGTNADYQRLSRELHKRDMKLIMDYVTNHWGAEHWMVKDLPEYDWIHQWPGYRNTNYRMTTQFDPHRSALDRKLNEEGWFTSTMPDLNQSNPLVSNYLIQNAIWWIEFADLDGFRVDTYSYNDKEGIARWTKAIMEEYPNFNIVGEVWMHDQAQIAYWQKDSPIGELQDYNSHLPSVMDFTLHDAIISMFAEDQQGWDQGVVKAYENFANDFLYADPSNLLVFAGNHDTGRINEIYDGDLQKYKLALALVLTTRGIPQLYYGDEIGMRGEKAKGDGDIRRDFPGGWPQDEQNAFTAAGRTAIQNAYHSFTRKLLQYRKHHKVLHHGKLLQFVPQDNVYVYFRILGEDRVMVVLNNASEAREISLERFQEGLRGSDMATDIISGEQIPLRQSLQIPAKSPLILELKKPQ